MADAKGLLDLPPELLDRIYSYLIWDQSIHFEPKRADLFAISLTCKTLQVSVNPLLYRNVTLRLRWRHGVLLEPTLLNLRRHRPDLSRHIRRVHIASATGQRPSAWSSALPPPFKIPVDIDNWLDAELGVCSGDKYYERICAAHRGRVEEVVGKLYQVERLSDKDVSIPAESKVRQILHQYLHTVLTAGITSDTDISPDEWLSLPPYDYKHSPDGAQIGPAPSLERWFLQVGVPMNYIMRDVPDKHTIDGLATVMLCLPPTITEMTYEAYRPGSQYPRQTVLGTHVAAVALKIFAGRLEYIGATARDVRNAARDDDPGATDEHILDALTPLLLEELTAVKKLTIAGCADEGETKPPVQARMSSDQFQRWTLVNSPFLTTLSFWNLLVDDSVNETIVHLVAATPTLETVHFENIIIFTPRRGRPATVPPSSPETVYLYFAVALRRAAPTPTITFANLHISEGYRHFVALSKSALVWLEHEAIPPQANITFEREERLREDFESFLSLWQIEDGVRGEQAAIDRQKQSGALVDAAFSSRWKTYVNVRKDMGEWATI